MGFKEKRQLILSGNLYKVIFIIALPVFISNLVQRVYTLTDMFYLGKLGSLEVAALTFIDPILGAILNIGNGLSIPIVALVSQSIGRKDYEGAKKHIGGLLFLSLIVSFIICVFGLLFSSSLLKVLGLEGRVLALATPYLKLILFGTIFTLINTSYIAIKQAEGNTMSALYLNLFALIFNIILNPIFIFTFKLGIVGAALATVASKGLISIYGLWDLFRGRNLKIKREHLTLNRKTLHTVFHLGIPAIITRIASPIGNIIVNSYAIAFGPALLAAVGLGNKINSVFFCISYSLSLVMMTITGQNLGNNNPERVKEAVKKANIVSFITGCIGTFSLIYFSEEVLRFFTPDPKTIEYGKTILLVTSPTIFLWGVYQIIMGVYQGAGFTKISMWITLTRFWVLRLPLIFILNNFIGVQGLWYSTVVATNLTGLVSIIFYLKGSWLKKNKHVL